MNDKGYNNDFIYTWGVCYIKDYNTFWDYFYQVLFMDYKKCSNIKDIIIVLLLFSIILHSSKHLLIIVKLSVFPVNE